jgi:meso-butanediol dehydrogenase/(S,S)-butanediol dehydrogenase/diacetyl reductase
MPTARHEDKVVIVTGGAHGIGAATVRRFLAEGAKVVAADINADGLTDLVESAQLDGRLSSHLTDVSSFESVTELIESTIAQHGVLDVLVNNAGIGIPKTIEELSVEEWQRVLDVDLNSIFYGAKAALPHLRKSKGNIVNTASISGLGANTRLSAYFAAKGGVVNFTRYLAVEYGPVGIRVNAVNPGPVNTNPALFEIGNLLEEYIANIPLKRLGTPEDVAAAIVCLASDDASYISGHNLVIDGALTAWTGEPALTPYLTAQA